jgi:hypothetical protein
MQKRKEVLILNLSTCCNNKLHYSLYKCKLQPVKFEMFNIISIAAIISYFIPLFIVLVKRLWSDAFFMLFATYWAIGGLINIIEVIPGVSKEAIYMTGVLYNMLDIPFILGILYCTSNSILVRKFTSLAFLLIFGFQVISVMIHGINYDALKYPLGTGIAMVLIVVSMEIIRYMQKIEHSNRQNAKIFIYAAVLFEYATFIVIYVFDYFMTLEDRKDSFLIYYISSLVAILIASCGYMLFKKYERKNYSY